MSAPAAEGSRLPYDDLPAHLHEWVDRELGSPVGSAVTQPGGFSPGVAARLVCADGRRAFCKAVADRPNPDAIGMHRLEASVTARLPVDAPAPRLLASYDDGRWVVLLLQDVAGRHPALPWDPLDLDCVVRAFDELAGSLTPAPLPDLPSAAERLADDFTGWQRLAADAERLRAADDWSRRHVQELAGLEGRWPEAAAGQTLLHLDLRADNLLIDDAGQVWVVDWPWAAIGDPLLDLVGFAPSLAMQGGPDPMSFLEMTEVGARADVERLTVHVAALAGFFVECSLRPPPPGLPTVREFQRAQGVVALGWLRELTGWR